MIWGPQGTDWTTRKLIKEALCSQCPFRYLRGGTFPSTHGFTGAVLVWRIPTRVDT